MALLLAAYTSKELIVLFGVGVIILMLSLRIRRQFKNIGTPSGSLAARTQPNRPGVSASTDQVATRRSTNPLALTEAIEVEMHDLARQTKAEIDSKMVALQQLICMADEAAARLQGAIDHAESLGLLEPPLDTQSDELNAANSTGRGSGFARKQTAPTAAGRVYSGRLSLSEKLTDDPRYERVFALADAGFTPTRIATQTGMQVGEVELILSLRPARQPDSF